MCAAALSLLLAGCGPNESVLRSGREEPSPAPPAAERSVEAEIELVRTAGLDYILVIRRRDGAALDPADRAIVKAETANAERRIVSDAGRAIIIGNKFRLEDRSLKLLSQRFATEEPKAVQREATSSSPTAK